MDLHKINGPQDYNKFYQTSSEGLVWWDGKGNPIPVSHILGAHVEAIDQTELWNFIQTSSKVHRQNIPVLGHGPTNSTAIDPNTPPVTTPTSPIMDHHVKVNQPEWSKHGNSQRPIRGCPHSTWYDVICIKCSNIAFHPQLLHTTD